MRFIINIIMCFLNAYDKFITLISFTCDKKKFNRLCVKFIVPHLKSNLWCNFSLVIWITLNYLISNYVYYFFDRKIGIINI